MQNAIQKYASNTRQHREGEISNIPISHSLYLYALTMKSSVEFEIGDLALNGFFHIRICVLRILCIVRDMHA